MGGQGFGVVLRISSRESFSLESLFLHGVFLRPISGWLCLLLFRVSRVSAESDICSSEQGAQSRFTWSFARAIILPELLPTGRSLQFRENIVKGWEAESTLFFSRAGSSYDRVISSRNGLANRFLLDGRKVAFPNRIAYVAIAKGKHAFAKNAACNEVGYALRGGVRRRGF